MVDWTTRPSGFHARRPQHQQPCVQQADYTINITEACAARPQLSASCRLAPKQLGPDPHLSERWALYHLQAPPTCCPWRMPWASLGPRAGPDPAAPYARCCLAHRCADSPPGCTRPQRATPGRLNLPQGRCGRCCRGWSRAGVATAHGVAGSLPRAASHRPSASARTQAKQVRINSLPRLCHLRALRAQTTSPQHHPQAWKK